MVVFAIVSRSASGRSPMRSRQKLRVGQAGSNTDRAKMTFSETTFMLGYQDIPFLRELFATITVLVPRDIR